MTGPMLRAPGEPLAPEDVTVPKARALIDLLRSDLLPYIRCIEARRTDEGDVVVFEVEPEVPQEPATEIRRTERLAVTFYAQDDRMPETVALRADFPQVAHLNLRPRDYPWRSLCLYDEPYEELKVQWTAASYVRRVHEWLSKTARGELHQADQPLEPFILAQTIPLVLPPDLFAGGEKEDLIAHAVGTPDDFTIIARRGRNSSDHEVRFAAVAVATEPQTHGVVHHQPTTVAELHELLKPLGCDLLDVLRRRLNDWRDADRAILDSKLILLVSIPKRRDATGPVEAPDVWAFATGSSLREVGAALDLWEVQPNGTLAGILRRDPAKRGQNVEIDILRPVIDFSRESAAALSGMQPVTKKVVAIGAGALGSQVVMNLLRMGFGAWTIIDSDHLLPHNLARHELPRSAVGYNKACALSVLMNDLFEPEKPASFISADVVRNSDDAEIHESLRQADLILDMSASWAVARHLATEADGTARRISLFINPGGTDLVLLAEDAARTLRLDDLEMQYYRKLIHDPDLAKHLQPGGQRLRYAASCRDVTSTIPQDLVAVHSGVGARAVRRAVDDEHAAIAIWRVKEDVSVSVRHVTPEPVTAFLNSDWTIRTDAGLIRRLQRLRRAKLPKETGGILIGHHDMARRIIYVVDGLPAPPDSKERPVFFERGSEGLRQDVAEIEKRTAGMLTYIGEWHSHPEDAPPLPSDEDRDVFTWLRRHMAEDGLPPLMAIVSEDEIGCYVDRITAGVREPLPQI